MVKKRGRLEALQEQTCPACDHFFQTMQGLMAHQSASSRCSWYKKGKLKAIYVESDSDSEDIDSIVGELPRSEHAQ